MNFIGRVLCIGGAALLMAACTHMDGSGERSGEITVNVGVSIHSDGGGGYYFAYSGDFSESNGNLDFSEGEAYGRPVRIEFAIDPDSVAGIKFRPTGADAMWIVEKEDVGPDGSPRGPYRGAQFVEFSVDPEGTRLTVIDKNDDGKLYRYGLRFDVAGKTIVDDPDVKNGGGGGHG